MENAVSFEGFIPPTSNYFKMPNEWINICAEIDNLAELKIIQYVLRHTWGFKEYDGTLKTITVDEFMKGRKCSDKKTRIDKGTGLKSDRSVKDGIKAAIEHGYLVCETDKTDLARIKKAYALKMLPVRENRQVDTTPLPTTEENRQVDTTPQSGRYYPSGGQILPLNQVDTTLRSEKDTSRKIPEKDTKERQDEPPFFKPLSSKQIQKQNEVRASEIWALVEAGLKTTFSKTQRMTAPNQQGMNNLLEDEAPDATISKALKNMSAFYRQQFNLKKFHELMPGLLAEGVEPPVAPKPSQNGNGYHKPDAPPSYEVIHNTKDPRVVALLRGDILDDDPDIFPGTGNRFTREKVYERNALYRDDVTTGVPRTHQERQQQGVLS